VTRRSRRSGGTRKLSSANGFSLQVLTSSESLLKPAGLNSFRFPFARIEIENLHASPQQD